MSTTATAGPTLAEAKQVVIQVLTSEGSDCFRVMSPDTIAEEFVLGKGVIVQDEDIPAAEVYEAFDAAIAALAAEGVLTLGQVFGLETCSLSDTGVEKYA